MYITRDVMDDQVSESEFEMSSKITHSIDEADSSPSPAHSDPKYTVFESCLLPLFRRCTQCGLPNTIISYTVGTQLHITATCPDDHTQKWSSQSFLGSSATGNVLLAAAILYSGTTFTTFANVAKVLGLVTMSERTFHSIQKAVLFPTVHNIWLDHRATVVEYLKGMPSPLKLSGDGRCDSPGYSAKYCTYSIMDQATSLIADYQLVQVSEVSSSSVAMEPTNLNASSKFSSVLGEVSHQLSPGFASVQSCFNKDNTF